VEPTINTNPDGLKPGTALTPLVTGWLRALAHAKELKKKEFGDDANEARGFFNGPYNWMYKRRGGGRDTSLDFDPEGEDDVPSPTFQMTVNKAAEIVQIFGPAMYQRNPDRKVTPRRDFMPPIEYFGPPEDPNAQQMFLAAQQQVAFERAKDKTKAALYEAYLNFTPREGDLRLESRLAVDEALITGMSVCWCEYVEMPGGMKVVGTFYDSIDNVLIDPEATRLEEARWIARQCIHPVWEVEREYQLPPGTLKGNYESSSRLLQSQGDSYEGVQRGSGATADMLVYWKVFSKMGPGHRLKGVADDRPAYKALFDTAPEFCFLAIADNCGYPLNLPPAMTEVVEDFAQLAEALQWPVPFWLDRGKWPMSPLVFHHVPGRLWPISHLKPALGELKFINWTFSLLMGKIRVASRDILVIASGLADEAKNAITHGPDYSIVQLKQEQMENIDKVVKFIQHPGFNPEIEKVLVQMIDLFEKRTGLTDLVYGETSTQLRSAAEADVKQTNANVRPGDMAQVVEDWASECARKEMACARWVITPQDVQPVLGSLGAWLWQTEVLTTDPASMFHQFECGVEAGSTKRPNRERDAANLQNAMQILFAPLFQYAQMTGDVRPINKLITDWAVSIGMDPEGYLLQPPPPPPPPEAGGQEGGGKGPPGQEKKAA
jgi:hypothetical protein